MKTYLSFIDCGYSEMASITLHRTFEDAVLVAKTNNYETIIVEFVDYILSNYYWVVTDVISRQSGRPGMFQSV